MCFEMLIRRCLFGISDLFKPLRCRIRTEIYRSFTIFYRIWCCSVDQTASHAYIFNKIQFQFRRAWSKLLMSYISNAFKNIVKHLIKSVIAGLLTTLPQIAAISTFQLCKSISFFFLLTYLELVQCAYEWLTMN